MTNRNLQFYGLAYGDTPVTVDVKINGQQVFLNTVSTIPGDMPMETADNHADQVLFEVNDTDLFPVAFGGSYSHSIEVSGGSGVLLGSVLSNYMETVVGNHTFPNGNVGNIAVAGNATSYSLVYYGEPVNSENTPDSRSSVQINGVTQVPPCNVSTGCWVWALPNGSNLSCNLNISVGNVAP
jgi:hypothetical protein